jgi:SulP family sulfate permease
LTDADDPATLRRDAGPQARHHINGPFFFGAAEKFRDALTATSKRPRALILDMENVPVIDSPGLRVLSAVVTQCRRQGIRVYLADLQEEPRVKIAESPLGHSFDPRELGMSFDQILFALGPTGEMPVARMASGER